MPRSLFNFYDAELKKNESSTLDDEYLWVEGLKTINIGDSTVAVNPSNGGWAVFDQDEKDLLDIKGLLPNNAISEFLFEKGLCSKNGKVFSPNVSNNDPGIFHFFEFAVTTSCNLKCNYCFADASPAKGSFTTKETARIYIDRIAEYIAATRSTLPITLEFTGGEPLLNFPLIRYTIEYAKNTYGDLLNLEYCLQSNSTLLNSEMINFFKEHNVGIGISCDGFESVHNAQRPFINGSGSYKNVEKSLLALHQEYPENSGGVIAVISDESVKQMTEIALYLHLLGFNSMVMRPLSKIGRGFEYERQHAFVKKYNKGLFNILHSVITPIYEETGQLIKERYLSLTFKHLLQPYRPFMCERTPCGAGREICVVAPDGNVYACNQSLGEDHFYLGNLYEHSFIEMANSEAAQRLSQRTIDRIEDCNECVISSWCGSPCPFETYKNSGTILTNSSECQLMKDRYIRALKGLIKNEYNLEVISRIAELEVDLQWDSVK